MWEGSGLCPGLWSLGAWKAEGPGARTEQDYLFSNVLELFPPLCFNRFCFAPCQMLSSWVHQLAALGCLLSHKAGIPTSGLVSQRGWEGHTSSFLVPCADEPS